MIAAVEAPPSPKSGEVGEEEEGDWCVVSAPSQTSGGDAGPAGIVGMTIVQVH